LPISGQTPPCCSAAPEWPWILLMVIEAIDLSGNILRRMIARGQFGLENGTVAGNRKSICSESQRLLPGFFQIHQIGPDNPLAARAGHSQASLFAGLTNFAERKMLPNTVSKCGFVRRCHLDDKARRRLTEKDDFLCFFCR